LDKGGSNNDAIHLLKAEFSKNLFWSTNRLTTNYCSGNCPFNYISAALKPGVDKLEGFWFTNTIVGAGLSKAQIPNWVFTQKSVYLNEFSTDGIFDCDVTTSTGMASKLSP
jgi:hypothetical protein